jgi:hypothetical protein
MIGEELFLSVQAQALLLLRAVGTGGLIGVLYECFRIPRRLLQSPAPVVAAGDAAFCFLAALVGFRFLLAASDGRPRLFLLCGMAGGAACYFYTVGALISRITRRMERRAASLQRQVYRAADRAVDRATLAKRAVTARAAALQMSVKKRPLVPKGYRRSKKVPPDKKKIQNFFQKQ